MRSWLYFFLGLSLLLLGAACSKTSNTPIQNATIPSAKDKAPETVWPSQTAKYITAVPLDLMQIERISKYRSCAGHDRSGYSFDKVFETDRSMKHYVFPIPKYQGTLDQVKMFAPFDGKVSSIFLESQKVDGRPHNGNGITFSTPVDPGAVFQFGHLYFAREYKVGDSVKAGELVGYAALGEKGFDFDIDLMGAKNVFGSGSETEILGAAFDHMNTEVLTAFAARGITPEAMSWSKEYRDAHPCYYNEPTKADKSLYGRENQDWVALN